MRTSGRYDIEPSRANTQVCRWVPSTCEEVEQEIEIFACFCHCSRRFIRLSDELGREVKSCTGSNLYFTETLQLVKTLLNLFPTTSHRQYGCPLSPPSKEGGSSYRTPSCDLHSYRRPKMLHLRYPRYVSPRNPLLVPPHIWR